MCFINSGEKMKAPVMRLMCVWIDFTWSLPGVSIASGLALGACCARPLKNAHLTNKNHSGTPRSESDSPPSTLSSSRESLSTGREGDEKN